MEIDLQQHKVYVDSLKMDMVPYSIAIKAIEQAAQAHTEDYQNELENALSELRKAMANINLDQ